MNWWRIGLVLATSAVAALVVLCITKLGRPEETWWAGTGYTFVVMLVVTSFLTSNAGPWRYKK